MFASQTWAGTGDSSACGGDACGTAGLTSRAQQNPQAVHLEAIELARRNAYAGALERLRVLTKTFPADLAYAGDYAVVLAWSGRDAEALQQLARLPGATLPSYVSTSLAKSARNLGRYAQARELYSAALRGDPYDLQAHAGLAMTIADDGNLDTALAQANNCVAAFPKRREALGARAYVYEKKNAWVDALADYQRVLAIDPNDVGAKRALAIVLARLGAAQLALHQASAAPDAFSKQDLRRMRGDVSATLIRWGEMRDVRDPDRFKETDAALAQLAPAAIAQLSGEEALRARFDRIIALRDRVRMREVVAEYRKLQDEKVELPPYVATAVGDALLYLERPEQARELYAKSLRVEPNNHEVRHSLFFAQVEADDFANAFLTIDKDLDRMPAWRTRAGSPAHGANWDKLEQEHLSALGRAYTEMYEQAYNRLNKLADGAPMNADLRQSRADIARWRGWQRQAKQEYVTVLDTIAPEHVGSRIGRTEALLALRRYREVEKEINALHQQFPENKAVQNLRREWQRHNMNEVHTEYTFGKHTDSPGGSREHQFDVLVTSRPFSYNWRGFAHGVRHSARLSGGSTKLHHIGAGVEYANGDVRVRTEVTRNDSIKDASGFSLEGEYWVNDRWSAGADIEKSGTRVPLQARAAGVDAKGYGAWTQYRASELTRVRASVNRLEFDDGNDRTGTSLSLARRLATRAYYQLTLNASLSAEQNSRSDRPYFNPKNSAAFDIELENRWRVWRRYDKSFHHALIFGAGAYDQSGFATEPTGIVRYEHKWRFNDRLGVDYGISYNRRVYDGAADDGLGAFAAVNALF